MIKEDAITTANFTPSNAKNFPKELWERLKGRKPPKINGDTTGEPNFKKFRTLFEEIKTGETVPYPYWTWDKFVKASKKQGWKQIGTKGSGPISSRTFVR
jgi:hypothetical protein